MVTVEAEENVIPCQECNRKIDMLPKKLTLKNCMRIESKGEFPKYTTMFNILHKSFQCLIYDKLSS